MSKLFNIILTIILFIISLNYTNEIIIYFQKKDPLMQEIINKQNDYYIKPFDAVITKNMVIKEVNGRKIDIKKSYQKMKKLGIFNESLLVYEEILPNKSYVNIYDKVIIPRGDNNISLILEIDNLDLFNKANMILKSNNVNASLLVTNSKNVFSVNESNFDSIVATNYYAGITHCISFNHFINDECKNNKKYTFLVKENIISNNFLNNTKKAIDNGCSIIIYRFNNNNLTNLNTIIKYLKSNQIDVASFYQKQLF